MGRRARFTREDVLAATRAVIADGGAAAATMGAIAERMGAPTGSIYHRFPSRDEILAELWLDAVASFQAGVIEALDAAERPVEGRAAALHVPAWVRAHPLEARILLLHRREELVADDLPEALADRAAQANDRIKGAVRAFAARAFGSRSQRVVRSITYALAEAPVAAVQPYIRQGERPPALVDELVGATYDAVVARLEEG